ncbi:MAG: hypothetical protein ACYDC6_16450 [Acidobacteriaceae bacterium]
MGLELFRGLAVIMIAWFGIQNALSTAQGFYGSFHFGQFANLLLVISFGLGMLTYYYQRENPRLCRGGSSSLTFPGLCLSPFLTAWTEPLA